MLIAGGGTGGHLFPALAAADALRRRGAEILFIGTRAGIEARVVPQRGFPIEFIPVAGFKRRRIAANLLFPVKAVASFLASIGILRAWRPQAALGTGGYVCGPVLMAAVMKKIPIFLQEQNSYPGVTTRLLARFARTIYLNFAEASDHLPGGAKTRHVGNPVRTDLYVAAGADDRHARKAAAVRKWGLNSEMPTLLIFGGSQGARSLNRAAAEKLSKWGEICNLIWGYGKYDVPDLSAWQGPGRLAAHAFIDDMPSAYAAADLAVCRSGAMTLSELQAAALPAILIPFPHAAGDHQRRNAIAYAHSGGALVLQDRELSGDRLWTEVRRLLSDTEKLESMRRAQAKPLREDAAAVIAEEILAFIREKSAASSGANG